MALTKLSSELVRVGNKTLSKELTDINNELHGKMGATSAAMNRFMKKLTSYRYGYAGTQTEFRVYGFGSSVGIPAGGLTPDEAPVQIFFKHLNATVNRAGIFPLTVTNKSVGGSAINDFLVKQWPEVEASGVYPDLAFLVYGMNDFATSLVNAGQGFGENGFKWSLRSAIQKLKDAGCDVVLTTTPHSHTGRTNFNLPASVDMTWPIGAAKPVSGGTIRPTLEDSKKVIKWRDGEVPVSTRFLWGNDIIRQTAAEMGCLLLDAEKCWFDALLTYTEDDLFNEGQENHPNRLGHKVSYWTAIEYFFNNLESGTWYDGGSHYPRTIQTSGTGLNPNPTTADVDLQATGDRQYAQIFRDRWGRPTLRMDQQGNLDQFWYTNDNPTVGNPGYVASLKTKLHRAGTKGAGDTVVYTCEPRQGMRLRFHAWSSSLANYAQMVELLVCRTDSGYTIQESCVLDPEGKKRLFDYTASSAGVTFSFKVAGTVFTCLTEEFGSKYT